MEAELIIFVEQAVVQLPQFVDGAAAIVAPNPGFVLLGFALIVLPNLVAQLLVALGY